jgi:hypothetical protein
MKRDHRGLACHRHARRRTNISLESVAEASVGILIRHQRSDNGGRRSLYEEMSEQRSLDETSIAPDEVAGALQ